MKLEKILEGLNFVEKNSFLKIIGNLLQGNLQNQKEIDVILSETTDYSKELKNVDNVVVSKIFKLLHNEYTSLIKNEFLNTTSQIDILIDILSRDGNSMIKYEWFAKLYKDEIKNIKNKIEEFNDNLNKNSNELSEERLRDYKIYNECLKTSYYNDESNNLDKKITPDENSILITLSRQLGLSQKEIKLINYSIVPIKDYNIDEVINELKSLGIIFYSKKTNTIYVADEIVMILRKIRGKEIADKYFRRVLKTFKDPIINLICKQHNIDRKLDYDSKIKEIIKSGINFSEVLYNSVHKPGTNLTDKKKFISELCDKNLRIEPSIKGVLLEDKIENLISYFDSIENDDKIGISVDGYSKMLSQLNNFSPKINSYLKEEFELQEENVLNSALLLDYNIKPRDVLELISQEELQTFCKENNIKSKGNQILNILENFKDTENLYLENYVNIANRDINSLKENGIDLSTSDLGLIFEDLTKKIFSELGLIVDDNLKNKINTSKDKIDIILNQGNDEVILVECKTSKDSSYNKFSAVSRQLKSYSTLLEKNNLRVIKSLLVSNSFTDEFIKECGLEYELNLSLITADTLIGILEGFRESKLKVFPFNLLMRDVVIQKDRVIKAITK